MSTQSEVVRKRTIEIQRDIESQRAQSDYDSSTAFASTAVGSWVPAMTLRVALAEMDDGQHATVTVDSRSRPHCIDGKPAVQYSDAREEYYWHGVKVPDFVISDPSKITVEVIEVTTNAEVKRVMMEKYGIQRYMQDCGARLLHKDETGELYRKTAHGTEALCFVKVKNSTAEPDGTFKDYFLRVPPTMKKAREAVAWTFRMTVKEYDPALET